MKVEKIEFVDIIDMKEVYDNEGKKIWVISDDVSEEDFERCEASFRRKRDQKYQDLSSEKSEME